MLPEIRKNPLYSAEAEVAKLERDREWEEAHRKQVQEAKQKQAAQSVVRCPRCGSTQIELMRGYGLFTGFYSDKVNRVCMNCKHKF